MSANGAPSTCSIGQSSWNMSVPHDRSADLGDELVAPRVGVVPAHLLQLGEAVLAELAVGGPLPRIGNTASRRDGPFEVLDAAVGCRAGEFPGGGVAPLEASPGGGLDEFAVDQHPGIPPAFRGK